MNGGESFKAFMGELQSFCATNADHATLGGHVRTLSRVVAGLKELATNMRKAMEADLAQWAATTYPGLICFGEAIMVWRLLDLAVIAQTKIDQGEGDDFYKGKVLQATYFADMTVPALLARLEMSGRPVKEVAEMPEGAF